MTDMMRLLAAWMLVHEVADEGMKSAVERGATIDADAMAGGPEAFADGLVALVHEEKERLKAELAAGGRGTGEASEDAAAITELTFEVRELRGRLEAIESALDAIARSLPGER